MESLGLKRKIRKKAPNSTEKQKKEQRKTSNRLRFGVFKPSENRDVVMDDESYFDENGMPFGGNKYYFTTNENAVSDNVKFRSVKKFPMKVLAWITISPKGHSKPYFDTSRGAIGAKTYKNECIKKRLVPFIKRYHSDGHYAFWPDLASAHYARSSIDMLEEYKVKYVSKSENPPNVSQSRHFENLWEEWKRRVFAGGWTPNNLQNLIERIRNKLRTFKPAYFQKLMRGIHTKIRRMADCSPLSLIH